MQPRDLTTCATPIPDKRRGGDRGAYAPCGQPATEIILDWRGHPFSGVCDRCAKNWPATLRTPLIRDAA